MTPETHQVSYGPHLFEFRLTRRARKTMSISVTPSLTVDVVAPLDAPFEQVCEKVRKRAPWIRKQLQFFQQFQPRTPERRFVAGETHLYLGRQYKLKVVPHVQQRVKLYRGRLVVQTHNPHDDKFTRELVENWYRERAHAKFRERLVLCQQLFPDPQDFKPSGLVIRQLSQRWGSMTPGGKLILHRSLVSGAVDCIDYVITHELCHLKHANHGPAFYALLNRIMPDWERRKLKLERQLS
ncbi:metal-dependent hydrolase [Mesorhizobium tianshanense]|uniref:YgjP-like metallopeptidase domain-containing protein n=1 Tax=Mesorhizobium tianshanense TaxID=39844 RepID=A0A562MS67_9HYPH|nr:SprT family zinc-dependent metalloprotease [Mesorhizobium tianshanense]TWI22787.1 hypothetical protein IQ26_06591 [Mesorhizobium tianshanense]GLS37831.1 metal-dependent hydrolase [Mesorhizobium tianshanense]